jgi:2-iminobutanoate/2-iminopropanoate deaminase
MLCPCGWDVKVSRRRVVEIPNVRHAAPIPAAVVIGNVLASSAIFGADQGTGQVPEDPSDEVTCLFRNVASVVELAGGSVDDVLRMGVLIRENSVREFINREWLQMFPDEADRPARHITVVANLPVSAQIELLAVIQSAGVSS